jgi:putative Mn2+ efflux pump MntP
VIVHVAEYLAWIISAALGAWMLFDAVKVSREHSEEYLTTSVEGTDELLPSPTVAQPLDPPKEEQP